MTKLSPKIHLFAIAVAAIAMVACGGHKVNAGATDETGRLTELVMPTVPSNIKEPHDRAVYVINHFWDNLEFSDTARSCNDEFMEQSFANYLTVFPLVDEDEAAIAVEHLLAKARVDTAAYRCLRDIARKYLYHPNSPMLNEDYYALFLPPLIADTVTLDEATRDYYGFEQMCIEKNHKGTVAADFLYVDRNGTPRRLSATDCRGGHLMLLFVDADCPECRNTMDAMSHSEALAQLIADGRATMLTVCVEGTREKWKEVEAQLPTTWITGYDVSGIEDNDLYILRAMPTIYVLDSTRHVELKDATPQAAIALMR
jgi:hypothetical protein